MLEECEETGTLCDSRRRQMVNILEGKLIIAGYGFDCKDEHNCVK